MRRWIKDNWLFAGFTAAMAIVLVCAVASGIAEALADVEYADRCEQRGGHVLNISRDPLCVSDDGRVIEP